MTDSARPARLRGRFLFLDGLRGVAALLVALGHFAHPDLSPIAGTLRAALPSPLDAALDRAHLGVEIFFVLSGFVIAHSLWGRPVTPRYAGNFALRRSLRLDPPYWTMIAFAAFAPYLVFPTYLDGYFARFGGVGGLLANMFYLQDLLGLPGWVGVGWTLCLEVQFYLAYVSLLAFAQLAMRRVAPARPRLGRAVAAAPFVLLAGCSVARWLTSPAGAADDFGGRWHMFFAGALLYAHVAGAVGRWPVVAYLAAVGCGEAWRGEASAVVAALTAAAIWAAVATGGLRTWLSARWLQSVGHRSYSLYLVHLPVGCTALTLIKRSGDGSTTNALAAYGAAILFSVVAADLLYRFVESPAARLSARLRPRAEADARGVGPHDLATGHVDRPDRGVARGSPEARRPVIAGAPVPAGTSSSVS